MRTGSEGEDRPVLLALRALKLGDLLVAVPALRGLRRAFPDHRLVLATSGWLAPIVRLVGGIDELMAVHGLDDPLPVPPGLVDVAVNLHGNGPESRGRLEALVPRRRMGHLAPGWEGPSWLDDIHERERWARLVRWHGVPADASDLQLLPPGLPSPAEGAVVVHVGAFYGARHWPEERFARVVAALRAQGRRVVLSGGAEDRARAELVAAAAGLPAEENLAGQLPLEGFAALIAAAAAVISVDTGAAHLASAYRRPSVVLFGPAAPEHWGPPQEGPHIVLTDAARRRGEVFASEPDPALLAVQPEDVLEAFATLPPPGTASVPAR